jgi:hypothetical protein
MSVAEEAAGVVGAAWGMEVNVEVVGATHGCHTLFLCQNQVLIICMTQDQLFHTYSPKMFTDNQMS